MANIIQMNTEIWIVTCVLLATVIALDHALADGSAGMGLGGLAVDRWEPFSIKRTAMGANRTIGPKP